MEDTVMKYTKEQILASKRFRFKKDAVDALLEDDKSYTIEEVESKIEEFYKKEV